MRTATTLKNLYEYFTGSTLEHGDCLNNFQTSEDVKIILISLKAGGLGLNLTKEDIDVLFE